MLWFAQGSMSRRKRPLPAQRRCGPGRPDGPPAHLVYVVEGQHGDSRLSVDTFLQSPITWLVSAVGRRRVDGLQIPSRTPFGESRATAPIRTAAGGAAWI